MLGAIIYAAQRRVDESETLLRLLGELARQLFLPSSFAVESARSHPSPPPRPAKLFRSPFHNQPEPLIRDLLRTCSFASFIPR